MPKVPTNTPGIEPVPPSTTMEKMITDSRKRRQVRRNDRDAAGVERAGQAGPCRAQQEGDRLDVDRVHAHRLGRQLILAHVRPGPSQPRVLQPPHAEDRDHDKKQDQVVMAE